MTNNRETDPVCVLKTYISVVWLNCDFFIKAALSKVSASSGFHSCEAEDSRFPKKHNTFLCKGVEVSMSSCTTIPLKMKTLHSFKILGTSFPVIQHHVPMKIFVVYFAVRYFLTGYKCGWYITIFTQQHVQKNPHSPPPKKKHYQYWDRQYIS
jgi:hypothetical protein